MANKQLPRSVVSLLAFALIVGALIGCSRSGSPTTDGSAPTSVPLPTADPGPSDPNTSTDLSTVTRSTAATTSTTSSNQQNASDDGFAWAPWGPASPDDPPPYQWYGSLERRDCDGLRSAVGDEPGRELWRALVAVCDAAISGDQTQWRVAQDAAQSVPAATSPGCLERAARALLNNALDWHKRNPGRQPAVKFPASGSKAACAFSIEDVRLVDKDGQTVDGPLEGPTSGGTLLAITGQGIDEPTEIRIGDRPAQVEENVFVQQAIVVRTPASDKTGVVKIQLRNRAGEVVAKETFQYIQSSGKPSSGTGTTP